MKRTHLTLTNPQYVDIKKYMGNKPPKELEILYNTCPLGNMFFPYYKNTRGEVQLTWRTCKDNNKIVKIKVQR